MMTTEGEIRAASEEFYAALNRMLAGDAGPLADIWLHDPTVSAMHPIGGREVGWDNVRASFKQVARHSTCGHVEMADRLIRAIDDVAYEVGVENAWFALGGQPLSVNSRATNIYRRQGGAWKVVHHHGDVSPGILETLNRLNE